MNIHNKRSYSSPKLLIYGDLATLTMSGRNDKAVDTLIVNTKTFGVTFEDAQQGDFSPSGEDDGRGGRQ